MKYLQRYISISITLFVGVLLWLLSVHTLRQEVIDAFIFAVKKNVSERFFCPKFALTSETVIPIEYFLDTLYILPLSSDNKVLEDLYFMLPERIDQTAMHLIQAFSPYEIDSLWNIQLKKCGLSGKTMVSLTTLPVMSGEEGLHGLFCETLRIDLGMNYEIKATAFFSYPFLMLVRQHPYLWTVYLLLLLFVVFFYCKKQRHVKQGGLYLSQEPGSLFSVNWDRAVIVQLSNGTYQIGGYLFKSEMQELLWHGDVDIKLTHQLSGLLLLFLNAPDHKLSFDAIKSSGVTIRQDSHQTKFRLKECFKNDSRIEVKSIRKWGFQLIIHE